jgi:cell wall-associated NlpC family hydrolase
MSDRKTAEGLPAALGGLAGGRRFFSAPDEPGPGLSAAVPGSVGRQRAAVVAEARSWVKTPYHHLGDVKGAGVDCAMLLVRVFVDLGIVPPFDPRPYPPDWHLHRSDERYLGFVLERGRRVETPREGDIMVLRYGRAYAHGGIVTGLAPLTIVHAFQPYRLVLEEAVHGNPEIARRAGAAVFASLW